MRDGRDVRSINHRDWLMPLFTVQKLRKTDLDAKMKSCFFTAWYSRSVWKYSWPISNLKNMTDVKKHIRCVKAFNPKFHISTHALHRGTYIYVSSPSLSLSLSHTHTHTHTTWLWSTWLYLFMTNMTFEALSHGRYWPEETFHCCLTKPAVSL